MHNIIYFISINILTFILYGLDKFFSKKRMFRISEKFFFLFSLMGGFLGSLIGMYLFRHKTRKNKLILINWLSLILWILVFLLVKWNNVKTNLILILKKDKILLVTGNFNYMEDLWKTRWLLQEMKILLNGIQM